MTPLLPEQADALDLPELRRLTDPLSARGWRQDRRREHRWFSPKDARIDRLPVGAQARRDRRLRWPLAETTISLVGFGHVFDDAVERELAPGLRSKVVPVVVFTLLKIVSYLDQPKARQKDLADLAAVIHAYEEDGDRRFSDEVIDAGVDYAESGAYLLGRDLARLCTEDDEREVVERFLRAISDEGHVALGFPDRFSIEEVNATAHRFASESSAFVRGWVGSSPA
jgi:predicted nucleotidyltransferase